MYTFDSWNRHFQPVFIPIHRMYLPFLKSCSSPTPNIFFPIVFPWLLTCILFCICGPHVRKVPQLYYLTNHILFNISFSALFVPFLRFTSTSLSPFTCCYLDNINCFSFHHTKTYCTPTNHH